MTRVSWSRVGSGVLLGTLAVVALVLWPLARAQQSGEPVPLVTALQVVAVAAQVDLVVADVPIADVYIPFRSSDWFGVLGALARSHGLELCALGGGTYVVTGSAFAHRVCQEPVEPAKAPGRDDAVVSVAASADTADVVAPTDVPQAVPAAPARLSYRVRVVQIDESRAHEAGLNWDGGVFRTAATLVLGAGYLSEWMFPAPAFDEVVSFLEREGVGTRLDDVTLVSVSGVPVSFNRGGSINVNLPASGGGSISQTFAFGLGLELDGVVDGDAVDLVYRVTDSAPSSTADPTNVQLASTTTAGATRVSCGHGVIVASVGSERTASAGSGLPIAAAVPVVGYLAGRGSASESFISYVVTVDVECRP